MQRYRPTLEKAHKKWYNLTGCAANFNGSNVQTNSEFPQTHQYKCTKVNYSHLHADDKYHSPLYNKQPREYTAPFSFWVPLGSFKFRVGKNNFFYIVQ